MNTFGELLGSHQKRRNLSVKALAEAAKLSSSYVSLLIRGTKESPSTQTVAALASALELSQEEAEELYTAANLTMPVFDPQIMSSRTGLTRTGAISTGMDPEAAGILGVHNYLSEGLWEERIPGAQEHIRIQDTWLPDPRRYRNAFQEAAKRNPDLQIEILLINPESEFTTQRAVDLDARTKEFVADQIHDAIHDFTVLREWGVHIEVRLYDSFPSVQQIASDAHLLVGFFIHGERSDLAPQIEIANDSALGKFFEEEFQRVWKTAKQVVGPAGGESPADH